MKEQLSGGESIMIGCFSPFMKSSALIYEMRDPGRFYWNLAQRFHGVTCLGHGVISYSGD